jgi:voltage-gated potassium channel
MELLFWGILFVLHHNEFNTSTPEGRGLAFIIAIFGYTIFGYVAATFATFFIGRDAEEEDAPVAGSKDIDELKKAIQTLSKDIQELRAGLN